MRKYRKYSFFGAIVLLLSCEGNQNQQQQNVQVLAQNSVHGVVANTIMPTYDTMSAQSIQLANLLEEFKANPTEEKLQAIKDQWKLIRKTWELSEGFLFGPVSTENIDPRLDTWPINIQDLEALLKKQTAFDQVFLDLLEDGLKGFHPLEYLLWGKDGHKNMADFDSVQINYMIALSKDIAQLSESCFTRWLGGYEAEFKSNTREAMIEICQAMQGICAEVADGKLGEPFHLKNAALEESPFSKNSLEDFKNNINSVSHIYHANFSGDGSGMDEFVKFFNLSLHNKIENQIRLSKQALESISVPFGDAIFQQPVAVQNAIDQIAGLSELFEMELLPLIQDRL